MNNWAKNWYRDSQILEVQQATPRKNLAIVMGGGVALLVVCLSQSVITGICLLCLQNSMFIEALSSSLTFCRPYVIF